MGDGYAMWRQNLTAAIARFRGKYSNKQVTNVTVKNGQYLRLNWVPESGGKYPDRGNMSIGNQANQVAQVIANHAGGYQGMSVRVLDFIDDGGYKSVAWVGPLPPDMEHLVVEQEDSEEAWQGGQQQQPMAQQQMPMAQQPVYPQNPQAAPQPEQVPQQQHPQPGQQPPPGNFGYGQQF